jgi:hypothetical protein
VFTKVPMCATPLAAICDEPVRSVHAIVLIKKRLGAPVFETSKIDRKMAMVGGSVDGVAPPADPKAQVNYGQRRDGQTS